MIAPLRRRHRLFWVLLAFVAPALVSVGLALRPERVTALALPTADLALDTLPELASVSGAFADQPLVVRIVASAAGPLAEIVSTAPLEVPEPLLYASASTDAGGGSLPTDARLFGSIDELGLVRGLLRDPDGELARTLWLYSLGHGRVVAVAKLPEVKP